MNKDVEQNSGFGARFTRDKRPLSVHGKHFLRLFLVSTGVILLGLVFGIIGLFFLFQGSAIENETINRRVEQSITTFLGPQYDVRLGPTKVEFHGLGKFSITSTNVKVLKLGDDNPVAVIGKVLVGLQPLPLIRGQLKIDAITIESSKIDMSQFPVAGAPGLLSDINKSLSELGARLEQFRSRLAATDLQTITISNSELTGISPGPRSTGKIIVEELRLAVESPDQLNIKLVADTGISKINGTAVYEKSTNPGSILKIDFDGLDVREWVLGPESVSENVGILASDAKVSGRFFLPFNDDNSVQQPVLNLMVLDAKLRLGRKGNTNINRIVINFRLFPGLNRIILERSILNIGGFRAQIVGGITPVDFEKGLLGDIDYTLVVERAEGKPLHSGEKIHSGSMLLEGSYIHSQKLLNINQWKLVVTGGSMVGSASLGFDSETPSFVFNGVSGGMPMAALKQFWPIFITAPARKWVQEHVHGGNISSAVISASIPGGILGRLHKGKRIGEDQLTMDIKVENVRFDTFGELPPVRSASGVIAVRGMRTQVNLDKGVAYVSSGSPVNLDKGKFVIPDVSQRPLQAELSFVAAGPISSLARIANAQPLNVMNRMKMSPSQWSGSAEIDMVANFPLKKNPKYEEVTWQALVRLDEAASSKLIDGRKINQINVVVDLSPDKAVITGGATIDGIRGQVRMIEPVGRRSKVLRKRVLMARMGEAERKKIGLAVEAVISGTIDVTMEQYDGRKAADISVDLTDAKVSLPWIGWRKGVGIPASAKFQMAIAEGVTKIHQLTMVGQSFSLSGDLDIDKDGVVSADFPKVTLNENDDLAVRVRRENNLYTITANGKYFDGRVLVNKLFHQTEKLDTEGTANFKLSANIQRVKGFGNKNANNVILHYSVKKGWLESLSLNTYLGRKQLVTIKADTKDDVTSFKVRAQNAGNALSFLNLYTHMVNGVLVSDLKRGKGKPFIGNVLIENFIVVDEPKFKKLVSSQDSIDVASGGALSDEFKKIQTNRLIFPRAEAAIEKGPGYLKLKGSLTGIQIGLTYNGTLYDKDNRMDIAGTFMPAFGISRMVAAIPFVGQILSNGRDSGLIGITYRISGPAQSPKMRLNPLSIVAPGIFKKIFEPPRK